jgi:cell division GTPase FtsZ
VKLLVIGCGQCGGRIADEFTRQNRRARIERGIPILTAGLAVNTDIADLSGLTYIKPDNLHRIIIGRRKSGGHGVGKINELGAEIAHEDGDKVLEAVSQAQESADADAFLLVAGASGGTGSGSIAELARQLKEHYSEKPIYGLIVLPFRYEEATEERSIYNVGTCLKSIYLIADAVFLVDNQRYIADNASIRRNLAKINNSVVEPFYNLLCAGEETEPKYIGSRVVDAGDIIQTLSGWTVIGYGQSRSSRGRLSLGEKVDFRNKVSGTERGIQAMNQAKSILSLKCRHADARRALYLLTGPPEQMSLDLINDISNSLRNAATEAVIRSGDYPRGKDSLDISLILSELTNSRRISDYFSRTLKYIYMRKSRRGEIEQGQEGFDEALRDIPTLL